MAFWTPLIADFSMEGGREAAAQVLCTGGGHICTDRCGLKVPQGLLESGLESAVLL